MKKFFALIILVSIVAAGCQQDSEPAIVDIDAVKADVISLADKYHAAWHEKDVETMLSLLADDGLFCGSDPSEILDKKALSEMWIQTFSDTTIDLSYSLVKRELKIASGGSSAIIMEHTTFPAWSPNIPMRQIYHAEKTGGKWLIDFMEWSFIINNDDVGKLNKSLE